MALASWCCACSASSAFKRRMFSQALHSDLRMSRPQLLKVFLQVHVGIQRGDLIGVAVEHQRSSHEELAKASFGGLVAKGGSSAARIDIRIKRVVLRSLDLAGRGGQWVAKSDLHD